MLRLSQTRGFSALAHGPWLCWLLLGAPTACLSLDGLATNQKHATNIGGSGSGTAGGGDGSSLGGSSGLGGVAGSLPDLVGGSTSWTTDDAGEAGASGAASAGGEAGAPGLCQDGAKQDAGSCAKCGTLRRTCLAGAWGDPVCEAQGVCEPQAQMSKACGCYSKGSETDVCSAQCQWAAGTCSDPCAKNPCEAAEAGRFCSASNMVGFQSSKAVPGHLYDCGDGAKLHQITGVDDCLSANCNIVNGFGPDECTCANGTCDLYESNASCPADCH